MGRNISRRDLIGVGLAGGALAVAGGPAKAEEGPLIPEFELEEATIEALQEGMRSGRWTAQQLVEATHKLCPYSRATCCWIG